MSTVLACAKRTCFDPDEQGCNMGHALPDCPFREEALQARRAAAETPENPEGPRPTGGQVEADAERHLRLPWTGNSLGVRDLELVAASNRTTMVGVVGPYNAGKTTLLTMIYLLLRRGEQLPAWRFAGSSTLIGWENLAAKMRWQPGEGGPRFPEHTSRGAGRRPGLLHLAIRGRDEIKHDFLLTDPPGEWFSNWALKAQAEGAEGARWVERHGDRFLLLVDRDALCSAARGKARDLFRDLARRLSDGLRGRPVAVVWTKSDKAIPQTIESHLRDCFKSEFPNHPEFRIRMRFGNESHADVEKPCLDLMDWMFAPPAMSVREPLTIPAVNNLDLFLNYRGHGVRS